MQRERFFIFFFTLIFLFISFNSFAPSPVINDTINAQWQFSGKVIFANANAKNEIKRFIVDSLIFSERWDTLPQIIFWRLMMNLHPDTSVTTIAVKRQIVDTIIAADYDKLDKESKLKYKDSLRKVLQLPEDTKILVTAGRKDFYLVREVMPTIDTAIQIFASLGVDPFYSQCILLIESPSRLEKSWAGAYGPFQLMKKVGLKYGLVINKNTDERTDLCKSARTAAMYLSDICIPEVKKTLEYWKLPYNEKDLYFRLLVLHAYHAGSENVKGVIGSIEPKCYGSELIQKIWQTEYNSFKNASQNYSQVALAATLELYKIILQ
jgi:hypothetical protein